MTPLVSDKYRYILFYNPKSACSVARQVFLELHRTELPVEQQSKLNALRDLNQDDWHDIHQLFPMLPNVDYSGYFKFTLVRQPLMRFVSAYLNRIVLQQTDLDLIQKFFSLRHGTDYQPSFSFNEFVDYITESESGDILNKHFLSQSHTVGTIANYKLYTPNQPFIDRLKYQASKFRHGMPNNTIELDLVCKVEAMTQGFSTAYKKIFRNDNVMEQRALEFIARLPLHNVTFTSKESLENAASLSAEELRSLGKMPSYTSFLTPQATAKLQHYYADDLYNYRYRATNDKSIDEFEAEKNAAVQSMVPVDFDWRHYLESNADLGANGINNKTAAISHWIHHGRFEDRAYRK
jgi:hypothetical protein